MEAVRHVEEVVIVAVGGGRSPGARRQGEEAGDEKCCCRHAYKESIMNYRVIQRFSVGVAAVKISQVFSASIHFRSAEAKVILRTI